MPISPIKSRHLKSLQAIPTLSEKFFGVDVGISSSGAWPWEARVGTCRIYPRCLKKFPDDRPFPEWLNEKIYWTDHGNIFKTSKVDIDFFIRQGIKKVL